MPWGMISNILIFLLNWLVKRSEKSSAAQKQITKLAHKMDELAKQTAKLKKDYEDTKKKLRDQAHVDHVEE